jgi:putative peptidoglycan lipid II flippase
VIRLVALAERFVPPGALMLATLTFGSYAMGLVRDRAFAHTFGAGAALDAYNAAFVLPELLLDVLVASGLTAPFVPIFIRLMAQSKPEAERFARTVATAATGLMLVVSLLLFVAAPATTSFIAPGFSGEQAARYVELFRLMCLTPALFALSIALGELLVAERRFVWYALAPILYNAGIVGGTILLGASQGIRGAAIGTVVGAGLHLGIRVVGILRTDFRFRPAFAVRTADFREFLRLMLPKMAAHPIEPITFLFFTQLATTLGAGTVSSLSFARNFQSVPVNLIGAAFSIAIFPTLSAAAAAGDRAAFRRTLGRNLLAIGGISVAAAIALALVGNLAIRLLLGGGAFDDAAAARTSTLVVAFAVSVPFDALSQPLARGFYATRNTLWPVLASVVSLGVIVASTNVLVPTLGMVAIPAGFALGSAAKVAVMAAALPRRIAGLRATGGVAA